MSHFLKVPLANTNLADVAARAKARGIEMDAHSTFIEIYRKNDIIRVNPKHQIYYDDVVEGFDYYFDAVEPILRDDKRIVDYSLPRFHQVKGFGLMPVLFSSFAEPICTARQYLDIATVPKGAIVLDLGGYSGLTSILFAMETGHEGRVICVEPDKYNLLCIRTNLSYFNHLKCDAAPIEVEPSAVWAHNDGVVFSTEGNMGSAVTEATDRGESGLVPTITLSELTRKYDLKRIDFIKCDVEGSESYIFEHESDFLKRFRPRIIIEPHYKDIEKNLSISMFSPHLQSIGYHLTEIPQPGAPFPLVFAVPAQLSQR